MQIVMKNSGNWKPMPIIEIHSSIKIMIIFNNTSADFVLISADVLLKIVIILIELRIAQLF